MGCGRFWYWVYESALSKQTAASLGYATLPNEVRWDLLLYFFFKYFFFKFFFARVLSSASFQPSSSLRPLMFLLFSPRFSAHAPIYTRSISLVLFHCFPGLFFMVLCPLSFSPLLLSNCTRDELHVLEQISTALKCNGESMQSRGMLKSKIQVMGNTEFLGSRLSSDNISFFQSFCFCLVSFFLSWGALSDLR